MRDFHHVFQRTKADCGVAALAMFLGRFYEEIEDAIPTIIPEWNCFQPITMNGLWAICELFDAPVLSGRAFISDKPAIITVLSPSPDRWHYVYWDGDRAYDPLPDEPCDAEWIRTKSVDFTQRVQDLRPLLKGSASWPKCPLIFHAKEQLNG